MISTVNIQHLESLNDVVERITGITQRETVPDAFVRSADQVELVDMSPEALRRRLAHGNVYTADKVDAALGNYFRVGNLTALRELALLWMADRVDESLQDYLDAHGISTTWETKERVVVAHDGLPERSAPHPPSSPHGDAGQRRPHRCSHPDRRRSDQRATTLLDEHRALLEGLGGTYHEIVGSEIPTALTRFARAEHATQIVLGASRRSRWRELTQGSVDQLRHPARRATWTSTSSCEDADRRAPHTARSGRPRCARHCRSDGCIAGWAMGIVGIARADRWSSPACARRSTCPAT